MTSLGTQTNIFSPVQQFRFFKSLKLRPALLDGLVVSALGLIKSPPVSFLYNIQSKILANWAV